METKQLIDNVCSVCGKATKTACTGCADRRYNGNRSPTPYCGKTCQSKDWPAHKKCCHAAQALRYLFRAGELMQETFFAVRGEVFDLSIDKVERDNEGKLHILEASGQEFQDRMRIKAAGDFKGDPEVKRAILSFCAGGDLFYGAVYSLALAALEGHVQFKVQKFDVRIRPDHLLVHRRSVTTSLTAFDTHHILCITLKDDTTWAVDVAGAQHGQLQTILPLNDYIRDYVTEIIANRPFGAIMPKFAQLVKERHSNGSDFAFMAPRLLKTHEYVTDEMYEWEHKQGITVKALIKAEVIDYERLKAALPGHLTSAAREYVKLGNNDPTSTARVILVSNLRPKEDYSEEEWGRMQRKKARWLLPCLRTCARGLSRGRQMGTPSSLDEFARFMVVAYLIQDL